MTIPQENVAFASQIATINYYLGKFKGGNDPIQIKKANTNDLDPTYNRFHNIQNIKNSHFYDHNSQVNNQNKSYMNNYSSQKSYYQRSANHYKNYYNSNNNLFPKDNQYHNTNSPNVYTHNSGSPYLNSSRNRINPNSDSYVLDYYNNQIRNDHYSMQIGNTNYKQFTHTNRSNQHHQNTSNSMNSTSSTSEQTFNYGDAFQNNIAARQLKQTYSSFSMDNRRDVKNFSTIDTKHDSLPSKSSADGLYNTLSEIYPFLNKNSYVNDGNKLHNTKNDIFNITEDMLLSQSNQNGSSLSCHNGSFNVGHLNKPTFSNYLDTNSTTTSGTLTPATSYEDPNNPSNSTVNLTINSKATENDTYSTNNSGSTSKASDVANSIFMRFSNLSHANNSKNNSKNIAATNKYLNTMTNTMTFNRSGYDSSNLHNNFNSAGTSVLNGNIHHGYHATDANHNNSNNNNSNIGLMNWPSNVSTTYFSTKSNRNPADIWNNNNMEVWS